jgi:putative nucleotidyltransferase with HDIG domain
MALARNPHSTLAQMERVVGDDPVLTGRIVEMANTAMFGRAGKVDSVRRAIQRLGFRRTRDTAVATALASLGRDSTSTGDELWQHAVRCGTAARALSPHLRLDAAQGGFVAALLHDLGRQLMAVLDEAWVVAILREEAGGHPDVEGLERSAFGTTHAELGAACMRRWGFDEITADVVASHHLPTGRALGRATVQRVAALQLADAFAHAVESSRRVVGVVSSVSHHPAVRVLGLRYATLDALAETLVDTPTASRHAA